MSSRAPQIVYDLLNPGSFTMTPPSSTLQQAQPSSGSGVPAARTVCAAGAPPTSASFAPRAPVAMMVAGPPAANMAHAAARQAPVGTALTPDPTRPVLIAPAPPAPAAAASATFYAQAGLAQVAEAAPVAGPSFTTGTPPAVQGASAPPTNDPPSWMNQWNHAFAIHLADGSIVFPNGEYPPVSFNELTDALIHYLRNDSTMSVRLMGVADDGQNMFEGSGTLATIPRTLRYVAFYWFQTCQTKPKPWGLPDQASILIPRVEPPVGPLVYRNGGCGGGGRYVDSNGVIHGLSVSQAFQVLKKANVEIIYKYSAREWNRWTGD
ncbi:hypothetical protein B7463_g9628, partial [Scytalidium lignicola]